MSTICIWVTKVPLGHSRLWADVRYPSCWVVNKPKLKHQLLHQYNSTFIPVRCIRGSSSSQPRARRGRAVSPNTFAQIQEFGLVLSQPWLVQKAGDVSE